MCYGAVVEDRVCITGGASQNLACLLQVYTDPAFTRNVWIVAPAYMLSFRIFEDAGFHEKLRAVPEDDEGIDIEYLRQQIKKSEDKAKAEGNNEPVSCVVEERFSRITSQTLRMSVSRYSSTAAVLR
jgi:aspartate/methionine/tyrosine aminotransferase